MTLHPIHVVHRSTKPDTLGRRFPGSSAVDVTSKGAEPWVRFSPFYPHGGIPVPLSPERSSQSVEGVWQGLKVFRDADVDTALFDVRSMRGLKRTERRFGPTLGHRAGVQGEGLLPYLEARRVIYLPTYRWVLDHRLQGELAQLRDLAGQGPLVLLDYETNTDPLNTQHPLSHAALIRAYLLDAWPQLPEVNDAHP